MSATPFSARLDPRRGLLIDLRFANGLTLTEMPVRAVLRGTHTFLVWPPQDSGEGPPRWAEPGLDLCCFAGPDGPAAWSYRLDRLWAEDGIAFGYRATGVHEQARVELVLELIEDRLHVRWSVSNPQPPGGRALPLAWAEISFGSLRLGPEATYLTAHSYFGGLHGAGPIATLGDEGIRVAHGVIGLGLPLIYLHDPHAGRGVEVEFMMEGRPVGTLRRDGADAAAWSVGWSTERLLSPGQAHTYGGSLVLGPYSGRPVEAMRRWRDAAGDRYGLRPVAAPTWVRRANIIEFNMNPANTAKGFTRLDDPACRRMLERWRGYGYNAIFCVSPNHVGQNWLSPFDYEPADAVGGQGAEKRFLDWAHELGFKPFLWVTTVGIDREAPQVKAHRDWFTHRPGGELFYAWDSSAKTGFVGYAPDADPLSAGWRGWLKDQIRKLVERGYDGIYVDGCIPRASNHARAAWPGEARNAVADQVRDLAGYVRTLGPERMTLVEDDNLAMQVGAEMVQGRYHPVSPEFLHPRQPIPPEAARDYLLVRYASLLPGVLSNDIVEGYLGEANRPWTVQSLLAGTVPKTHSQFVDPPADEVYVKDPPCPDPPQEQQAPAWRRRGHAEFVALMRFARDQPLLRKAPLSIEGVVVEGDAAVVGLLRPSPGRCLLALIQFAPRPATVRVRLAEPRDLPAAHVAAAAEPDRFRWRAHEVMRSMVDADAAPDAAISAADAMAVRLAPFGFRVFLMERPGG